MTAVLIQGVAENRPSSALVTFVLTPTYLVSVRYADPLPFKHFEARRQRQPEALTSGEKILLALLESIVERAADALELVGADLNEVSNKLFLDDEPAGRRRRKVSRVENELQVLIKRLGRKYLMVSILRESLLSLSRLLPFLRAGAARPARRGRAGAAEADRARPAVAGELRGAAVLGDQLSAPGEPGPDQPRTEPHHQGVFHRRRAIPAAHGGGRDLRHELQDHARTGLAVRLSPGACADAGFGGGPVLLVQAAGVAVAAPTLTRGSRVRRCRFRRRFRLRRCARPRPPFRPMPC